MKTSKNSGKILILMLLVIVIVILIIITGMIANRKSGELSNNIKGDSGEKTVEEEIEVENIFETLNFEKAIDDVEKKKDRGTAEVADLINLGVSYYNTGDFDKAKEAYGDAIAKDPNSAYAYTNLGNVFRDEENYREAETNYRKAIKVDSAFINAYLNLAVMFYALERDKNKAVQVLNQGLVNNSGNELLTGLLGEYSK